MTDDAKAAFAEFFAKLAAEPGPLATTVTLVDADGGEHLVTVDRIEVMPDGRFKLHGTATWVEERIVLTATIGPVLH